jgi:hypothetical protein
MIVFLGNCYTDPSTSDVLFYMDLPWVGLSLAAAILCLPLKYIGPDTPMVSRLMAIDPVDIAFNMAVPVSFALVLEFSGPVWDWGSGASIAIWVIYRLGYLRNGKGANSVTAQEVSNTKIPVHQ